MNYWEHETIPQVRRFRQEIEDRIDARVPWWVFAGMALGWVSFFWCLAISVIWAIVG